MWLISLNSTETIIDFRCKYLSFSISKVLNSWITQQIIELTEQRTLWDVVNVVWWYDDDYVLYIIYITIESTHVNVFISIAKMIKILSSSYTNFSPVKLTLYTTSKCIYIHLTTYLPYTVQKKKNNQNQTIKKNVHHDDRKLTTYTLNRWRRYTKTMRWKIKKKKKRKERYNEELKILFYFSFYIFDFLCPAESLNTLNKKKTSLSNSF